jgi:hypothetical protein
MKKCNFKATFSFFTKKPFKKEKKARNPPVLLEKRQVRSTNPLPLLLVGHYLLPIPLGRRAN